MKIVLKIALLLSLMLITLNANIVNTKHNLSASGTGTVKADAEDRICVFCHIPHHAQQGTPLWNREMTTSSYTMYDSEYLRRTGYPVPTDLGSTTGTPGSQSRLCMSCHDGTVAVGAVYILRGSILGEAIAMQGTEVDGTILAAASTNFGTDLSNHHPVGYKYDSTAGTPKVFGDGGATTTELIAIPTTPIKLHTYTDGNYVECTSCHDPHTDNDMFLRLESGVSHGENVKNTCLACHDKSGGLPWPSAHEVAGGEYRTDQGSLVPAKYNPAGVSVADIYCINCHTPHNGDGKPALLRKVEQNTCYRGAEDDSVANPLAQPCHQSGTPWVDIESIANRSFSHPINTIDGVHTDLDTLYGVGNTELDGETGKGVDWANSKHAECQDCHNPHLTGANIHTDDDKWYPTTPTSTSNDVSDVLRNVSGVEPTWPATQWTEPTAFTTKKDSDKEYQICLKCHSYWGLGASPAGDGVSAHALSSFSYSDSGESVATNVTDQAWEFNPNNRAAHPVVKTTTDMLAGARYANPIIAGALLPPWNVNVGTQTMYCSDCHGADDEAGLDAAGPHGSSTRFMLKGEKKNWPTNSVGDLYMLDDVVAGGVGTDDGQLFCQNCHVIEAVVTHTQIYPGGMENHIECVNCHVAVPHGSPISRMIGYRSMPAPYDYNNATLGLDGFRFQDGNTDSSKLLGEDAYSTSSCGGGASCHKTDFGGYDTIP